MSTFDGPVAVLRSLLRGGTSTRTPQGDECAMPRRLRADLDRALALPEGAVRRAAVDRVVRGIEAGAYGRGFRHRRPAPGAAPDA
ncbi:hypothetical protein [Streptomyces sp. NPDC058867]|uniref:hypothetical protein n=1 Tax=unclassified Streptomyces TaxID=2593676 RepID=UPI00369A7D11